MDALAIHHAIIHKLNKTEGSPSTLDSHLMFLPTDDEPLQQLV